MFNFDFKSQTPEHKEFLFNVQSRGKEINLEKLQRKKNKAILKEIKNCRTEARHIRQQLQVEHKTEIAANDILFTIDVTTNRSTKPRTLFLNAGNIESMLD